VSIPSLVTAVVVVDEDNRHGQARDCKYQVGISFTVLYWIKEVGHSGDMNLCPLATPTPLGHRIMSSDVAGFFK